MAAGRGGHAASHGRRALDDGFSMIEMLVSIAVIGIVMTSLTAFYVSTVAASNQQSGRQAAVHLADDAIERVRALNVASIVSQRDRASTDTQWASPVAGVTPYLAEMMKVWDATATFPAGSTAPLPTTPRSVTVNGVGYAQYWYVGTCGQPPGGGTCDATVAAGDVQFFRIVVAITWRARACANGSCSYVTSTLVNTSSVDPVFGSGPTGPPPAVTNPGAQAGELTVAASLQLVASGGTAPLTWAAAGVPPGLAMDSAGLISGTPTTVGSYQVTAQVTDAAARVASTVFTWVISATPQLTNPGTVTTPTGVPVTFSVTLTGGTAPITWTAAGAWGPTGLPPGLTINAATGVITGTPTRTGTNRVTITVVDRFGKTATTSFAWAVPGLAVQTPATQTNRTSDHVSLQIVATGGAAPYAWSATGLPPGLAIDPATGLITGRPTTPRRYNVRVTVVDAVGTRVSTATFAWQINNGGGG